MNRKNVGYLGLLLLCTAATSLLQAASEEDAARDFFAGQRMLVTYHEGGSLYGTRFFLQVHFCRSGNYMTMGRSIRHTVLDNEQVNNFNDQGRWVVTTISGQLVLGYMSVSGQSNAVPIRLLPNGGVEAGTGVSLIPQGVAQCR